METISKLENERLDAMLFDKLEEKDQNVSEYFINLYVNLSKSNLKHVSLLFVKLSNLTKVCRMKYLKPQKMIHFHKG